MGSAKLEWSFQSFIMQRMRRRGPCRLARATGWAMVAAAAVALGPLFCHAQVGADTIVGSLAPLSLPQLQQSKINFLTATRLMQMLTSDSLVHCNFYLRYHSYLTDACSIICHDASCRQRKKVNLSRLEERSSG